MKLWRLTVKCSGSAGLPISSYTPCSTPQYVGEPMSFDCSGAGGQSRWWARWWTTRRCSARRRRCTPSNWWPEVKTVTLRNSPPRDLSAASPASLFDHICDKHWSYLCDTHWSSAGLIISVLVTVWSVRYHYQWWRVFTLDITPEISSCDEIGDTHHLNKVMFTWTKW